MKKFTLFSALILSAATLPAQETVKALYSGDAYDVTWDHTLQVDASQFADGVAVGNFIQINLANATDVLEIKANGACLPGSCFKNINGATEYKAYITADMLDALKTYGLEICGASFTVTSVDVMDDGFNMPEGAVWGGYFWVDNWNTLELWKTAFNNYDGQRYLDIYLSADNGDYTGYFMKVMTAWDEEGVVAGNDAIAHGTTIATVDLKDIDLLARLATSDRLMVQSNPEGGSAYNLTALVLRHDETSAVVTPAYSDLATPASTTVYNLQGVPVLTNVTSAALLTSSLPAGLYIYNGRKYAVR
jgi:hypothetical protein